MEDKKFTLKIGRENLTVEINDLPEQANGSSFVQYGDTLILSACVMSKDDKADKGFFPLTVEYEEKYYAAGKIKGARYTRREGKPSDEAICNARLIDRAIRPRFPENFTREVQVVGTVLSWDTQNEPDILGLISASISLSISDIPWAGPIAAIRIGRDENGFILNPNYEETEKSNFDIVFTAMEKNGKILINMIEAGFDEAKEELIMEAAKFAEKPLTDIIEFQKDIIKKIGKKKTEIVSAPADIELEKEINDFLGEKLSDSIYQNDKIKRSGDIEKLKEELVLFIEEKHPGEGKTKYCQNFFDKKHNRLIHENVIKCDKRPDGRKLEELRKISCEAGLIPRSHGSGLFCRGQTKALSILTLGAPGDQQLLEGMEIAGKKRFMHHYNFPPYSVGEIKPMRGPGRREIGHGMLAEKAILPLIPNFEDFPYTIRIVTEILSSNGSTSMASTSSSSLALMDAGVPIKRPVAGIAMGLIQDEDGKNYKILTDIQGPEDHHGDMDFKVAGTKEGITAMQLDVKIDGITMDIMEEALKGAKKARLEILDSIEKTLAAPRPALSPFAPRILKIQINPAKIREVIGPGGKVINEIVAKTGASIDIQDTGLIFVTSEKEESAQKAVQWIIDITREVEVGEIFEGKVKRILEFGAFVEILPGQEGMIHISKLSNSRVGRVEDVVNIGDSVSVRVILIDELGRINLSLIKKNS